MALYGLYHVVTYIIVPGKSTQFKRFFPTEKERWLSMPGVKSVKAYAPQFGLGRARSVEVWVEIEDYATYDQWDQWFLDHAEEVSSWTELQGIVQEERARLMGDWPESHLVEMEE